MKHDENKTYVLEEGQRIIFDRFPLPPSSNALYKHFVNPRSRKVIRVSTQDLKKYKKACEEWKIHNQALCHTANLYLKSEKAIRVDCYVGLATKKIWKLDGGVKKLDVSNRGKALLDCLADVIDIDDKLFSTVQLEKVEVPTLDDQCCLIIFSRYRILSLDQVRAGL